MTFTRGSYGFKRPQSDESIWLRRVNALYIQYLRRRRLTEGFTGDVNGCERRAECLRLAEFFDAIAAEGDPEATEEELTKRFNQCMASIKDFVPSEVTA